MHSFIIYDNTKTLSSRKCTINFKLYRIVGVVRLNISNPLSLYGLQAIVKYTQMARYGR